MKRVDCLIVKVSRQTIQGGLTNDEYDDHDLTDWRLQHHYPTNYVKALKKYEKVGDDSKFTDIQSIEDNRFKAEGKKMTKNVMLCPSRDTGVGRSFNEENLNKCFEINKHYFLYRRGDINETTVEFIIYWIPIEYIKEWYFISGNKKGSITESKIQNHINECEINTINWDRS